MENPEYRWKAEMPIPTDSLSDKEAANEHQGATQQLFLELVVCSELHGNQHAEVPEMGTRLELAYLAGIMDGDGCFALNYYKGRNRGRFAVYPFVQIKQIQREALDLLVQHFGGKLFVEKPTAVQGKSLFRWRADGQRAYRCCQALLPYLRLKRRQAEICIAVQDELTRERYRQLGPPQEVNFTKGKRRVRRFMISDASLARRVAWLHEIRQLNDTRQVKQVTE